MITTSESINELAAALAKAQSEMENVQVNKENPHFRSKYPDLASVRDATLPHLNKHGLSIVQFGLPTEGGEWNLHTMLMHTSGQWIRGMFPLAVSLDKPQVMGSFLTYARRYSHASMCCVAAEEDDDANAASETKTKAKTKTEAVRLSPEDSANQAELMIERIGKLKSLASIDDFAKESAGLYGRLRPEHQQTVRQTTNDKRAELALADTPKEGSSAG